MYFYACIDDRRRDAVGASRAVDGTRRGRRMDERSNDRTTDRSVGRSGGGGGVLDC